RRSGGGARAARARGPLRGEGVSASMRVENRGDEDLEHFALGILHDDLDQLQVGLAELDVCNHNEGDATHRAHDVARANGDVAERLAADGVNRLLRGDETQSLLLR